MQVKRCESVTLTPVPSAFDAAVCPFGAAGNLEDDYGTAVVIDQVDQAEVANAKPPKVRARELDDTRRARLDRQRQDRAAKAGGLTRWESPELALGSWS